MPDVPLWVQILGGLVTAAVAGAGGVLAWVRFRNVEHPASQAQTAHLRAETENLTVKTLRETLQEVREQSEGRQAEITQLWARLDSRDAAIEALQQRVEEQDRELRDLRRRLDQTPAAPPATIPPTTEESASV